MPKIISETDICYDVKNVYNIFYSNQFPRKIFFTDVTSVKINEFGEVLMGKCIARTEDEAKQIAAIWMNFCKPEDLIAEKIGTSAIPLFTPEPNKFFDNLRQYNTNVPGVDY